jgi:hypothetical protein
LYANKKDIKSDGYKIPPTVSPARSYPIAKIIVCVILRRGSATLLILINTAREVAELHRNTTHTMILAI